MTWNTSVTGSSHKREVALRVATGTCISGNAAAVTSAADRRHVIMLIVPLERTVGRRMTIHTAWIHNHLCGFGEKRTGARLSIQDSRKLRGRTQFVGILRHRSANTKDQQY